MERDKLMILRDVRSALALALVLVLVPTGCRTTPSGDDVTGEVDGTQTDTVSGELGNDTNSAATADPGSNPPARPGLTTRLVPSIYAEHPHDPMAFTQGLLLHNGELYESTGLNGRSSLRRVDPVSGDVLQKIDLDERYFGEGLTMVDDRLIQLTWLAGEAFVYDRETFEQVGTFEYEGEGWGMCYDGARIVMSDGGAMLEFRDPETFEPVGEVEVTLDGAPLKNLNELACVGGRVWANVWLTDMIVEIDPESGHVVSVIDAAILKAAAANAGSGIDVLNGIAHDPDTGRFFVTGKQWPLMFEVDFVLAGSADGGG